jgi:flagellum-specific peptidoglycan hydrolase FlgJ
MRRRKNETPEEFRARMRARHAAADPEYREMRLAHQRERRRGRYATDPVYREQLLKRQRERYETDPEYRQQIVDRERKRYARKTKGPTSEQLRWQRI